MRLGPGARRRANRPSAPVARVETRGRRSRARGEALDDAHGGAGQRRAEAGEEPPAHGDPASVRGAPPGAATGESAAQLRRRLQRVGENHPLAVRAPAGRRAVARRVEADRLELVLAVRVGVGVPARGQPAAAAPLDRQRREAVAAARPPHADPAPREVGAGEGVGHAGDDPLRVARVLRVGERDGRRDAVDPDPGGRGRVAGRAVGGVAGGVAGVVGDEVLAFGDHVDRDLLAPRHRRRAAVDRDRGEGAERAGRRHPGAAVARAGDEVHGAVDPARRDPVQPRDRIGQVDPQRRLPGDGRGHPRPGDGDRVQVAGPLRQRGDRRARRRSDRRGGSSPHSRSGLRRRRVSRCAGRRPSPRSRGCRRAARGRRTALCAPAAGSRRGRSSPAAARARPAPARGRRSAASSRRAARPRRCRPRTRLRSRRRRGSSARSPRSERPANQATRRSPTMRPSESRTL